MKKSSPTSTQKIKLQQQGSINTPTDLSESATRSIAAAMNEVLADVLALYVKTKNFHWHVSGPHFRDYHLLFDEQSEQLFAMVDPIAERMRKIGEPTLKSIGQIGRTQRLKDNETEFVEPVDMLVELCEDNKAMIGYLREAHSICEENNDSATTSLIEEWIDETEQRTWFLYEASRQGAATRH